MTLSVEDMGKKVAEQALDEYLINGKSLRKWITILSDELSLLDKAKTEIEKIADEEQKHDEKWAIGLRYAVKIIEKYREESEG